MQVSYIAFIFSAVSLLSPMRACQADAQSQLQAWLTQQARSTAFFDLDEYCQSIHQSSGCVKTSGSLWKAILIGKPTTSTERVTIANATVEDALDLSETTHAATIVLRHCHFKNSINLVGAYLKQDLVFDNSIVDGNIEADNLHIDGQLLIREHNTISGAADFTNAFIKSGTVVANSLFGGKLTIRRSHIGSNFLIQTSELHDGLDANFMQVDGSLNIGSDTTVSGSPLVLDGTTIGGRLDVYKSRLTSTLSARNMSVRNDLFFTESTSDLATSAEPGIDLSGSQVSGDLVIEHYTLDQDFVAERIRLGGSLIVSDSDSFKGRLDVNEAMIGGTLAIKHSLLGQGLSADRASVGGSVMLKDRVTLGSSEFVDTYVGGDMSLVETKITGFANEVSSDGGAFYAKGIRVAGTIYLGPRLEESGGGVNLLEARVTGNIEVTDAKFSSDFSITLSHVDHSVFIHETEFAKSLLIYSAIVGQHVDLSGNHMADVDMARTKIGADLRLEPDKKHSAYRLQTQWKEGSTLSLNSTDVRTIQDEYSRRMAFPRYTAWPDRLDLTEFRYQQFGDARDYLWARSWLSKQQPDGALSTVDNDLAFQPSRTLGAYFKGFGDDDDGDTILVDSKDQELLANGAACFNHPSTSHCLKWAKLTFQKYTINYGLGFWQAYVIFWSAVFIGIGYLVLSSLKDRYDRAWRLGASLNRLIPVLNLNKEFEQFFNRPRLLDKKQICYFYLHAVVGYVLALFIVAAFTGVIQAR